MNDALLQRLAAAHDQSRMMGWDFSRLDGRLDTNEPEWDFERACVVAMNNAEAVLDMGTGGGERLQALMVRLDQRPAKVAATEGWAPNVYVAREALAPLGIDVAYYDSERGGPMPFPSESFDLVLVRHESYDSGEVARVLRPGGLLLTQQVHGLDADELRLWFGGEPAYPEQTLEHHVAGASTAGLTVESQGEWSGWMRFSDSEALVVYMGLVPWDVPGFTVEPHLAKLQELEAARPIVVTQRRFWLAARKLSDHSGSAKPTVWNGNRGASPARIADTLRRATTGDIPG